MGTPFPSPSRTCWRKKFWVINEHIKVSSTLIIAPALSNSPQYRQWLKQTRHNWQPMIPDHDLSTQSTESLPSSQAETLSMQVDSPTESLCSQDRSSHAQASQRTIPLESQQSRSSLHRHLTNGANGARNSTAPASVVSVVDIVNYEINPGGGGGTAGAAYNPHHTPTRRQTGLQDQRDAAAYKNYPQPFRTYTRTP